MIDARVLILIDSACRRKNGYGSQKRRGSLAHARLLERQSDAQLQPDEQHPRANFGGGVWVRVWEVEQAAKGSNVHRYAFRMLLRDEVRYDAVAVSSPPLAARYPT